MNGSNRYALMHKMLKCFDNDAIVLNLPFIMNNGGKYPKRSSFFNYYNNNKITDSARGKNC